MAGWICHAVPAATGRPCGHENDGPPLMHRIGERAIECCQHCGCTRRASDLRAEKAAKQKEHR